MDYNLNSFLALQTEHLTLTTKPLCNVSQSRLNTVGIEGINSDLYGQHLVLWTKMRKEWSFKGGSTSIAVPTIPRFVLYRKSSEVHASCKPPIFYSTKHLYLFLKLSSYRKSLELSLILFYGVISRKHLCSLKLKFNKI